MEKIKNIQENIEMNEKIVIPQVDLENASSMFNIDQSGSIEGETFAAKSPEESRVFIDQIRDFASKLTDIIGRQIDLQLSSSWTSDRDRAYFQNFYGFLDQRTGFWLGKDSEQIESRVRELKLRLEPIPKGSEVSISKTHIFADPGTGGQHVITSAECNIDGVVIKISEVSGFNGERAKIQPWDVFSSQLYSMMRNYEFKSEPDPAPYFVENWGDGNMVKVPDHSGENPSVVEKVVV